MDKDEIHAGDIVRILLGDAPPVFLLEVLLRTLVVYTCFLIVMRWLGKRMAGQLSFVEMAVMLMLGAIVSPAMQAPDKGVIVCIFILFSTLLFQKGLTRLMFNKPAVHKLVQGMPSCLARDGVLNIKQLKADRITRQQIFAMLRGRGIYNLGQVERIYIEPYGEFSVYKAREEKPGLSLFPGKGGHSGLIKPSGEALKVCQSCGFTQHQPQPCPVCREVKWSDAIVTSNEKG